MSDDIGWIGLYLLVENGGALGTVFIYQASCDEASRKHAAAADLPVSEIVRIADTVVVRPDPA
jgi:hypothetical protein